VRIPILILLQSAKVSLRTKTVLFDAEARQRGLQLRLRVRAWFKRAVRVGSTGNTAARSALQQTAEASDTSHKHSERARM
jgi:hypothetical protein